MKKRFTQFFVLALFLASSSMNAQQVLANFDFDGDLQGWENNAINLDSVWQWSPDGSASQGAFAAPNIFINSPTVANGCMRFNSDFYITQGDPGNAPTGGASTYPKFICEVISPAIDLSGVSGAVSLRFSQVMRPLNLSPGGPFRTSFSISNDDGVSWSDAVDANPNVPVNATVAEFENGTVTFPITNVVGSSQVRIKFTYAMDFYFWLIDDVQLILREDLDMQANTNFYAVPHNAQTPAAQVENMYFLSDIENVGGQTAENVNLNVTITNQDGDVVYSEDQDYGSVGIDELRENVIFGDFTPAEEVNTYKGVYTVSADGTDNNLDNNTNEFDFEVTSDLYAKDLGATRDIAPAADNSFVYGNHYICNTGEWRAHNVNFGLVFSDADRAAVAGRSVSIWLYKWDDEDGDGVSQESERDPKGLAIYDITGTEDYEEDGFITVQLEGISGDDADLTLEEGAAYIVALDYQDELGDPRNCFFAASDNIDYNAMVFIHDSINEPRYGSLLDVGRTGEMGTVGFGREFAPIAQLQILPPVSTDDIELADNSVTIFPNPASHIMNVEVTLEERADKATFIVYDMDGKVVFTDKKQNVEKNTFEYNVSNLANGNYMLHMFIDGAYKTKSFTVAK